MNIINANNPDHTRIRKGISLAFSDSALREQQYLITQNIEILISYIRQQASAAPGFVLDLNEIFTHFSLDVSCELCLEESPSTVQKPDNRSSCQDVFQSLKMWKVLRFGQVYWPIGVVLNTMMMMTPLEQTRYHAGQVTETAS